MRRHQMFDEAQVFLLLVFAITLICNSPASAGLTYILEAGSRVAAVGGSYEMLTGTFEWELIYSEPDIVGYEATELFFESDSFTFTLNKTGYNDVVSSLFANGDAYFLEVVDATGFALETVEISSFDVGFYTGDIESPTYLECLDVKIVNHEGGPFLGTIDIKASLIPEPGTVLLLGLGILFIKNKMRGGFSHQIAKH